MGYRVVNGKLYPVGNFLENTSSRAINKKNNKTCFENILQNEIHKDIKAQEGFTISKHAAQRLDERNIVLDNKDMENINKGINIAEDKGAKDSLIIYKDVALVTSIKNRTIITAMDKEEGKGTIFTNIDSVVLI